MAKNVETKTSKKLYDIELHDLTYADVKEMKKQNLDPRFWSDEERRDASLDEKWADFIIERLSENYPEVSKLGFRAAIQYATDAYILTFGGEEAIKN